VECRQPQIGLLGEDGPVRRWTAALPAALLVLLASATGCSGDDEKPDEAATTPPTSGTVTAPDRPEVPPAPPEKGCYRLTLDELTEPTNNAEPVRCATEHTSQTIHVGRLRLVYDGHAVAVDSQRVRRQVAEDCPRRLADYVGGSAEQRDLSRFGVVWFSPTLDEADAGARWYRCDLVAFGKGEELYRQKGAVPRGVLGDGGLARFGLCGTAAPGSDGFERVLCSLPHTWRAIATIQLGGGDEYPGEDAVRDDGDSDCQDRVRELEDFALTFTYGWEWPTRAQWRAGQRYGFCWAQAD
jgi:hypothetical protein